MWKKPIEIREIIDKVKYGTILGKYKVYIIDEVHMMTTSAFNALLKTLEEPPAHVIFILATTEPHNIIPTILSRCQRYDFTKVSDGDIEERMMTILEKEGVQYDKEAVRAIISLADGGMRDALSILDQILAYSNNTLSVEDVYSIFGLLSTKEKVNLIKDITAGDVTRTLGKVKSFTEAGIDIKRLTEDLLEILKDVLIYKKTKDENELTKLVEQDAAALAESIETRKINEMISTFLKLQIDFKTASNVKTMFEIALLKLLTSDDNQVVVAAPKIVAPQPQPVPQVKVEPVQEVKLEEPKPVVQVAPVSPSPAVEQPKVEEPKVDPKKAPDWLFDDDEQKKIVETEGEKYELEDETIIKLMVIGDKELRHNIVARWDELDAYFGHPTLGDLVALLKDGNPFIATQNTLVLQYDFEKLAAKVNVKINSNRISDILKKMLGRDVFVYAVSRSESVRLLTAYQNLRQISKLPLPKNIKIELEDLRK